MIHQYQLGDYNIVLDVCSGGLHVVDGLTYDIIAELDEKIRNGNETKEASDSAFSEESENDIVAKMEGILCSILADIIGFRQTGLRLALLIVSQQRLVDRLIEDLRIAGEDCI